MERTLIVFKPDAVMRGVVGEILTRFERVGLKIVGAPIMNTTMAIIRVLVP
jgi:nucleoside-diphosphate kinase